MRNTIPGLEVPVIALCGVQESPPFPWNAFVASRGIPLIRPRGRMFVAGNFRGHLLNQALGVLPVFTETGAVCR